MTFPLNNSLTPVLPLPTGIDRFGFTTFGALPGGVPNPPNALAEGLELQLVRARNAQANASPQAAHFTQYLADHGGTDVWFEFAKQYRHSTGFLRGWAGTAMMAGAMALSALKAQGAKSTYQRLRPYQIDPSIRQIGKVEKDASYPSGHATAAFAAATVLATLWPTRASEFNWWAKQVGQSRVAAGMHFPSDVQAGAILGTRTALQIVGRALT
jgi:membrane-associated phospholipid phosphatase